MSLNDLWQVFSDYGYDALHHTHPADPQAFFYRSLVAFGHDDIPTALSDARQAARLQRDNRLFHEAAIYMQRVAREGKQHVYVSADAFTAFITGGGNVPLYAATSHALHQIYCEYQTLTLLDIGVGNGHALLPALAQHVHHIGLLEPSAVLLREVSAQLSAQGISYTTFPESLQSFVKHNTADWTLAQATYSLQSIPPLERPALLRALRTRTQRLILTEFDVPLFELLYAPDHVEYVIERYERGLAEYQENQQLVAQGFLLPVMFGYFDQSAMRTNYEQPRDAWIAELQTAGFNSVVVRELYDYWWAPAFLLDASATS